MITFFEFTFKKLWCKTVHMRIVYIRTIRPGQPVLPDRKEGGKWIKWKDGGRCAC
ncbi:hypothetical protein CLOSTASPAR_03995 [[Clostridium] asparagiforme DSM 15981]|uniref:Uncharacterized protein n=1 Tax=[Clostridium] asparagiforme DSM 15981 TaxID=518636 RepID=C0D403_9FIRM|nr:hypothetical protein CLOSTASPAR_03995 [[Clostridium] asparagiforme DSM 15981]